MKASAFTQDSYDGFLVERVRETSIAARYIEKLTYQETITDPFGNEEMFNYVTYRQVAFNLFTDFPNIELWDAPRGIQTYLSKLLELSDFSLSVNPLQVKLMDWVEALNTQIAKKLIIDSLQVSGLELEEGVNAKVLVQGDKDVREALNRLTKNKRYILEKLQIKVPFDGKITPIYLANNGTAKIPEEIADDILPLLRISLPNPSK
jgi:hypothetical protein